MLTYRHYLPSPNPAQPWPVLLLVHGWLGNENVMWAFEKAFPPQVAVFSPRAPLAVETGYGWFLDRTRDALDLAGGLQALEDFVLALPAQYPVDIGRLVVMGFSQGAALSYAYALQPATQRRTPPVQGLAALAGYLPVPLQAWATPATCANLPVFITHGTQDETVPLRAAHRAREVLQAAGAAVDYHEHATGHKLNLAGMKELGLWLGGLRP